MTETETPEERAERAERELAAARRFMSLRTFDGESTELEVFRDWLDAQEAVA